MTAISPYAGLHPDQWRAKTLELVEKHPLKKGEIVEVVLACWQSLFDSKIGTKGFLIGRDIFPRPQMMGFFLEQLITLEMATRHPKDWCAERSARDKDLVYLRNPTFSIEIKTSSHARQIFGNRSYAQESDVSKKDKSGYYLAVNFQKFSKTPVRPGIALIRFGWLDHTDWIGQKAQTGQQARVKPELEATRLLTLYALK